MTGTALRRRPADAGPGDAVPVLLGFTRALRAAGVPVTQDRSHGFLEATALVGLDDRRATYWAGRATLCAGPDDLARYDQVFEAWFDPRGELPRRRDSGPPVPAATALPSIDAPGERGRRRGRRGAPRRGHHHRGAAPPRRGHPRRRREAAARRDVRDPAAHRAHASYGPARALAPRPPRRVAHAARLAAPDGGARRPGLAAPARAPAPRRPARRRERLDERVRRRAAAPRPPLRHRPAPGRGLHPRHPAHPRHPRAAPPRPRPGASSPPARPSPTGPAAPGSARRCGSSSTAGASAGWRAGRSSWSSATAGSAATRPSSASRWRGCTGSPTGSCGSTRTAARPATSRSQGGIAAALPHCDDFVAGHSLAAFAELVEVVGRA